MKTLALLVALVATAAHAQVCYVRCSGAQRINNGSLTTSFVDAGVVGTDRIDFRAVDERVSWPGGLYYACNASLCYTNNDFGCAGAGTCNLGTAGHEFNQARVGSIIDTGSLSTTREFVIDKVSSGIGAGSLLAVGTNYSGYKLPAAWTVTHLSLNVTTASAATAANTVFTITDGTNTCTATFACNTVTNSTGAKDVATANGAGTGCAYAANAAITMSVTTQGCATAVTTNSITTWGKPQ